ncbi:AraC family transcriptional regulator [Paenibacillus arenilitoris]|uniref:AraC family transcriptional regulator n=1 Tax=Paenibacillus arenilitoris TaxID=2772299 RepID=A0A927CLV7_9BACL|nr:AraC family transcriptional regulator [Paenibacillus arenilitoris]MBD2868566.1 AraC family transcriptional regulator [Paenibacillus arenilitoris]
MKRIPMMLQLIVILFCVMAVPTVILTWYSGEQILRNSEQAIAESSLAGLNASRKLSENALNNLAQNTVRLTATHIFDRIRPYETFAELNSNFNTVSNARAVLQELANLNRIGEGVYSSFFHLTDSDYVVSTDKGIKKLERYESLDWMKEALAGQRGISGVWYPRKLDSGVNVVSYVLPLNRLSTTTRGTIVVNLRESQIETYFLSSGTGQQEYMLLNANGIVISHKDKSLLLKNGGEKPVVQDVLKQNAAEGYLFRELEGERSLYTWSRSKRFGWINVNVHSVNELMAASHAMQRNIMLLTAVIILAGAVLTVFLATWVSKPARELVRAMRNRNNLGIKGKNELAFLDASFKRMQEEEEALNRLLHVREQDARSLAVHQLIRGEFTPQAAELFPAPYFVVAIVSIDRYRNYVSKNNPETRSYHRYLLIAHCESLFQEEVHARCVYQGDGCFAIVINYWQSEMGSAGAGIHALLAATRDKAAELLDHSVTIGVSSPAEENDSVPDRVVEAMEAIKQRMIAGSGGILYGKEEAGRDKKYIYPANGERRILNFLDNGDLESVKKELQMIGGEIRSADYVSYDNILFVYHQLAGVTIKHLREKNVNTARIFAGRGNIYAALASIDTLDELEQYVYEFCREIVQYLARATGEANHRGERIIKYLNEHYREEIVFQEMAKEIGISYSYMRKIVYEMTGKSLIDYLNLLRIEKAKELLVDSGLTIAQIASDVGYYNVQSFNRFFRKFEGMPPSGYKSAKSRTS